MSRRALFGSALVLACSLGGCTLIDQRTFAPRARPAAAAPPLPADLALVSIRLGTRRAAYAGPLAQAVRAALAKKPGAAFLIEIAVADAGDPAAAAAAAAAARGQARAVMAVIARQGVAPGRMRLFARGRAGNAPGEIRVHVR